MYEAPLLAINSQKSLPSSSAKLPPEQMLRVRPDRMPSLGGAAGGREGVGVEVGGKAPGESRGVQKARRCCALTTAIHRILLYKIKNDHIPTDDEEPVNTT